MKTIETRRTIATLKAQALIARTLAKHNPSTHRAELIADAARLDNKAKQMVVK